MKGGLFKVADRIYQVRNQDISNLTIVEGDTGLIVFDPLISTETARAALELYFAAPAAQAGRRGHLLAQPRRPLRRRHGRGLPRRRRRRAGCAMIAPAGFLEAAVSENVLAGNAMTRRALYKYGSLLPPDAQGPGRRSASGMTTSLRHRSTLIPPTEEITETGQKLEIDGLELRVPARARHRGAGGDALVHRASSARYRGRELLPHPAQHLHAARRADPRPAARGRATSTRRSTAGATGPRCSTGCTTGRCGAATGCVEMLRKGRDAYRYINDETLRLANHGYTPTEIAEHGRAAARRSSGHWALRGYYGTVNHNVKATYVKYLGWLRRQPGQPPPAAAGRGAARYVEIMGGADAVLEKARDGVRRAASTAGSPRSSTTSCSPIPTNREAPRAAGRRARAARLPGRVGRLAQHLPDRRAGAARRRARHPGRARTRASTRCGR